MARSYTGRLPGLRQSGNGEPADQVVWGRLFEPDAALPGPPALIAQGNSYTFTLTDANNLIAADIEAKIISCANYVVDLISHYISWQGTMDFVVNIRPGSESPYPQADGIMPSVAQIAWNGASWDNQTLMEATTGTDANTNLPDAGCTIYLASDGTIRNYGSTVWFDPNPQLGVDPGVPNGVHDFIGIYTHEIFHAFGFYEVTQQWRNEITTSGNISYFTGSNAMALYGGQVPFTSGTDHYGNTAVDNISRGLMYAVGNYQNNRFDIGRIDLAILADLGHSIKTYEGLPLFEFSDTDLTLSGTSGNDILYGDYHANVLSGVSGNDLLIGGAGADIMDGWIGNDTYRIEDAGDVIMEGAGEGDDTLQATVSYQLAASASVETMTTVNQAATSAINLTGNELGNSIYGNDGANVLLGGEGVDQLVGNGGNDTLVGGAGADVLRGGLGNDQYGIDDQDLIYEAAGEGDDSLSANIGSYFLNQGASIETLTTANQAGTFAQNLTGNEIAQSIAGSEGANVLNGLGGNDLLRGYGGADIFRFDTAPGASNHDVIADMVVGVDRIALDNAVFTGLQEGNLGAEAFRIGTAALDADDRIVYNNATNELFFDADGSGAGAQILFAIVNGAPNLTAGDFTII